jgi:hypothetical protein
MIEVYQKFSARSLHVSPVALDRVDALRYVGGATAAVTAPPTVVICIENRGGRA